MALTFQTELTLDTRLVATFMTEDLGQVCATRYVGETFTEITFIAKNSAGRSYEICKINPGYQITCHNADFVSISTCVALLRLPGHTLTANWRN